MELLSPAGNLETAMAAFEYGADAVYVGLKQFSARADAENFSAEDLEILMGLAHDNPEWPRKVYVAVNTLLRQEELPQLLPILHHLRDQAVDGVIVQDLATAHLLRNYFPELPLHASTQMAIHNVSGMIACRDLGFSRVIAARELTLEEIALMAAVPGIELEVFIHGALCYAYSGLCLLSSVLRGHSGNRGECSYVCRNSWTVANHGHTIQENCSLMSMKDLAVTDTISALQKLKIASVKIEGRKKTPLYVAAVTNYYRNLIDCTFEPGERQQCEQDIKTIFSRPWTKFHLLNERAAGVTDPHTTGPRGAEVGVVSAVVPGSRRNSPDYLRFQLKNQMLSRHDGLQVEPPGSNRPYGFPVDELHVYSQGGQERFENVFTAEPEMTVEVPLPPDHPEIEPGLKVFCTSSQEVKSRYSWPSIRPALMRSRHPVYFALTIARDQLTVISQPCIGERELPDVTTTLQLETPLAPAKNTPEHLEEAVRKCFAKLGDTEFELQDIRVNNPEQLFVPVSLLNDLRRKAAEEVSQMLAEERSNDITSITSVEDAWQPQAPKDAPERPVWLLKVDRPFLLNLLSASELEKAHEVIVDLGMTADDDIIGPLRALSEKLDRKRIRLAIPTLQHANDGHDWSALANRLLLAGFRKWQISNLGALPILAEGKVTPQNCSVTADWPLYVTNRTAAHFLCEQGFERVTLAPDDTSENTMSLLNDLSPIAEIPVFQDTPLAISDVCAFASMKGFCPTSRACNFTELELTSRNGEELLAINHNCQTVYLRKKPLDRTGILPTLAAAGARYFRADFIWRNWSPRDVKLKWLELAKY
ncbi:MAG: U32 family peptidase [Victivallales bacterium]|nr:U32 family peptidase [Victivallales bacterium]